jgi:hypothetical protein
MYTYTYIYHRGFIKCVFLYFNFNCHVIAINCIAQSMHFKCSEWSNARYCQLIYCNIAVGPWNLCTDHWPHDTSLGPKGVTEWLRLLPRYKYYRQLFVKMAQVDCNLWKELLLQATECGFLLCYYGEFVSNTHYVLSMVVAYVFIFMFNPRTCVKVTHII